LLIAVRRAIQTLSTPVWNALADKTKKARTQEGFALANVCMW
jgi:hypothetical protein